jgi:hypothetical protein
LLVQELCLLGHRVKTQRPNKHYVPAVWRVVALVKTATAQASAVQIAKAVPIAAATALVVLQHKLYPAKQLQDLAA